MTDLGLLSQSASTTWQAFWQLCDCLVAVSITKYPLLALAKVKAVFVFGPESMACLFMYPGLSNLRA